MVNNYSNLLATSTSYKNKRMISTYGHHLQRTRVIGMPVPAEESRIEFPIPRCTKTVNSHVRLTLTLTASWIELVVIITTTKRTNRRTHHLSLSAGSKKNRTSETGTM